MRRLKRHIKAGKIRAIGVSNFDARKYQAFIPVPCGVIPAVDQVESHVYYPQLSLKKLLDTHDTRMQSWASFTEGRRNIFAEPLLNQIGAEHGKSAAQVALRYLVQKRDRCHTKVSA